MDERSTSFAKSVDGLIHEESALDRARALRDAFRQRQAEPEYIRHQERPEDRGSRMVRTDAPTLRPSPSGPMRWPADRQAFEGRLAGERATEKGRITAAELAQAFRQRQNKPSHDRDREH